MISKDLVLQEPKPEENSPIEIALDAIPSVDDEIPRAVYKDWTPEQTKVITYSVGGLGYRGILVATRDEAVRHAVAMYGKVLEANYVPGRAFLRVMR